MKPKSVAEFIQVGRDAGHDALGIANDPESIRVLQKIRYGRTDTYDIEQCAAFHKTREQWGGLSNMAGGFPITVQLSGPAIQAVRSTEALYQACRFPDFPAIQQEIIDNKSPMGAKFIAKREKDKTRPDWLEINVDIMRWCLNLKWVQNNKFRMELAGTGEMPIVEVSYKDPFWGAKPDDTGHLIGQNVLGKLLMELRDQVADNSSLIGSRPPDIDNLKLLGLDLV